MTPLQALRELQGRSLVTIEDEQPCTARLMPGMSRGEIDQLGEHLGAPIPPEVRELLEVAAGVEVDGEEMLWNGDLGGLALPEVFPCWVPVLEDGAGNCWLVDIDRETGAWGRVYYACHDAPVVVLQAQSLAEFIIQYADDCCQAGREGNLYHVSERFTHKVWDTGGKSTEAAGLRLSADPVLRRAATSVEDGLVCDLREARMGDGFSWGCFGARTIVTRPGPEPVWVLSRPAGTKKWWKLWG